MKKECMLNYLKNLLFIFALKLQPLQPPHFGLKQQYEPSTSAHFELKQQFDPSSSSVLEQKK